MGPGAACLLRMPEVKDRHREFPAGGSVNCNVLAMQAQASPLARVICDTYLLRRNRHEKGLRLNGTGVGVPLPKIYLSDPAAQDDLELSVRVMEAGAIRGDRQMGEAWNPLFWPTPECWSWSSSPAKGPGDKLTPLGH